MLYHDVQVQSYKSPPIQSSIAHQYMYSTPEMLDVCVHNVFKYMYVWATTHFKQFSLSKFTYVVVFGAFCRWLKKCAEAHLTVLALVLEALNLVPELMTATHT